MLNDDRPRKPEFENVLTLKELNQEINKRVNKITEEFTAGFHFIDKCSKSVTIFGSARTLEHEHDYKLAKELGYRISKELGYTIVTGGGPGIMEAANRGAFEAGGPSFGLTIKLPMEQTTNKFLTDHFDFYYFFSRKVSMTFAAEAYVYFPGGFGTLDELFEILTLVQTEKIEKLPIILIGKDYWQDLDKYLKDHLLGGDFEKIDAADLDLYKITDDLDEVLEIIKKAPIRIGTKTN